MGMPYQYGLCKRKAIILTKIGKNIPLTLQRLIQDNMTMTTVPYPRITLKLKNSMNRAYINELKSKDIYKLLVIHKHRLPIGMHKWTLKYNLLSERISNAFTFAWKCTLSTKSRNLQYKISTFTLPTGEYLWNYNVKDHFYCSRCSSGPKISTPERDNIIHALFSCPKLDPFLSQMFLFLINECKAVNYIEETDYLLGFINKDGLNSILLEIKKFIFYNFSHEKSIDVQLNMMKNRLRRLILLEKKYYASTNKLNFFYSKWESFSPIYMIYGPDPFL